VGAGAIADQVITENGLYPAEHRALRELHALTKQLAGHWSRLARKLGGEPAGPLERGAAAANELLRELDERTAAHELYGTPAAQGIGGGMARMRGGGDLMLERNQALRSAVLDAEHVTTLLAYLAALAEHRADADLAAWLRDWELRLRAAQSEVRASVVALGADPDAAIEPADNGRLGRAGHSLAASLGTLGEALDGSVVGRATRRVKRR
jgi:hypothetical protein